MQFSDKAFLENEYGYFDEKNREFVITNPKTPLPWVNYITNGKYNGLISHTGGGFTFFRSPKDSRITRWRYNSFPFDRPGRYIYLKNSDGKYWSLTWQPTAHDFDEFRCHHGMNYTTIIMEAFGIRSRVTYFVNSDENMETWRVELENVSGKEQKLDVYSFAEMCLGHALVDLINQPNDQHFNEACYFQKDEILFLSKRYWVTYNGPTVQQSNQAWNQWVFNASTLPVGSFQTSRAKFFGRWRSEANPLEMEQTKLDNSLITAGDAVSVLQGDITLKPGEKKEFSFFMGIVDKTDEKQYLRELPQDALEQEKFVQDAAKIIKKYRQDGMVQKACEKVKNDGKKYLESIQVELPDKIMQNMVNVWNQYQTKITFLFSRDASYYHGGLLFGRGYRDSCQDILGPLMAQKHEWVKNRILEMAKYQFENGSVMHCYYPLTGGGERTGHSDTTLWLPMAVTSYLKETLDFDILKEPVSFIDGEGTVPLLKHVYLAVDFALSTLTERNLPRFGPGDWNDTLDYLGRGGKGESVMVAQQLCYILKDTAEMCHQLGESKIARYYLNWYDKVAEAINTHCWDGEWYTRGTNDKGEVIGSSKNDQGSIFLNVQSWAVISGVANKERAIKAMDSVRKYLDTPKGPKILDPAFSKVNTHVGLATRCVPGKKENGAVFNHPVSWAILAECLLGRGENAYDYYRKALPMNPVIDRDRYEVEPYVYSEYVTSPDHETFGQASHSWLTGSSTWMLRDATDYILGVQPVYEGLKIVPNMPDHWDGYRVKRHFRGVDFDIEVKRETPKGSKVKSVTVDGKEIKGNIVKCPESGTGKCRIQVII